MWASPPQVPASSIGLASGHPHPKSQPPALVWPLGIHTPSPSLQHWSGMLVVPAISIPPFLPPCSAPFVGLRFPLWRKGLRPNYQIPVSRAAFHLGEMASCAACSWPLGAADRRQTPVRCLVSGWRFPICKSCWRLAWRDESRIEPTIGYADFEKGLWKMRCSDCDKAIIKNVATANGVPTNQLTIDRK